jgi:hypothetical protein
MAIRKITPRSILSGALTENLNIDSGTLYVDTSANRVGVGTTSPAQALDVVGSIKSSALTSGRVTYAGASGLLSDSSTFVFDGTNVGLGTASPSSNAGYSALTISNTTGGQIYWKDTNTSVTAYAGVDNSLAYLATLSNHPFLFRTNNTERMRITSAGVVGIGTSSPDASYRLNLSGTNTIFPAVYFNNTTSSKDYSLRVSGTDFILRDNTSGNDRLYVNTSGNVGIGTSSPNALLEVYGGDIRLRSTSNGANGFLTFVNTSNVVASSIYNYNGLLSLNEQLIIKNSTGNVGIGVVPTTLGKLEVQTGTTAPALWCQTGGTTSAYTIVDFRTGTNLPALTIYGNGVASFGGNVGIGTSSPGSPLTVSTTGVDRTVQINSTDGAGGYGAVLSLNNTGTGGREYNITSTSNADGGVGGGKLKFYDVTAATTRMLIDASGNVGIGVTPSAWDTVAYQAMQFPNGGSLSGYKGSAAPIINVNSNVYYNSGNKYVITAAATVYSQNQGVHEWYNAPSGTAGNAITFTQAMTLGASGALLIGGTSLTAGGEKLLVQNYAGNANSSVALGVYSGTGGNKDLNFYSDGNSQFFTAARIRVTGGSSYTDEGFMAFWTTSNNGSNVLTTSEKMRISPLGNLLVGTTSQLGTGKVAMVQTAGGQVLWLRNENASTPYGIVVEYTGASPNNTASQYIYCNDTTALRMELRSNGGIANFSANNVNLSDRREKTNFAPAKSYLDVICAIPVQTFNYIDQNLEEDDGLTLGVIAQDVQAVAPELVMESNWANRDQAPKMRLSIYQTDLQYALMKCIQEQQALIESLTTRLTALENK